MSLGEFFNSQFSLMQVLEFFLRILMAGFCGAVIGFERTRRFKEAGIRTHVIVSAAAALIMIVSKYGFADIAAGTVLGTRVSRGEDGITLFDLTLRMPRELDADELLRFSAEHDEVLEISNSQRSW